MALKSTVSFERSENLKSHSPRPTNAIAMSLRMLSTGILIFAVESKVDVSRELIGIIWTCPHNGPHNGIVRFHRVSLSKPR